MAAILEERGLDPAVVQANLERAAASCGVPFGKRTHTYNSRRANELGKWAELKGKRDAFDAAVFRAFFVERKNIAWKRCCGRSPPRRAWTPKKPQTS